MRAYKIGVNEAGQRLDKYLGKLLPGAPKSFIYKMLRKKNIVLNGKKADGSEKTAEGDEVKLWLADATIDEFMVPARNIQSSTQKIVKLPDPEIIYIDDDFLVINKPAGMLSQSDASGEPSMVEVITDYLLRTGKIIEEQLKTFHPSVCNRLDRNTSGLLCCGISLKGSQVFSEIIRERSVKKEYICPVYGNFERGIDLEGYLLKNVVTNKVTIYKEKPSKDAEYIHTAFEPLYHDKRYSLLLVHLITGKSHQIRAHLASIGHGILGDFKYSNPDKNKALKEKYGLKFQLLHAYRMTFPLDERLGDLSGKAIYAPLPQNFKKIIKEEGIRWQPGQDEA